LEWALVSAPSHGLSYTGAETAALAVRELEQHASVGNAVGRGLTRWDTLVSVPADGALVGRLRAQRGLSQPPGPPPLPPPHRAALSCGRAASLMTAGQGSGGLLQGRAWPSTNT